MATEGPKGQGDDDLPQLDAGGATELCDNTNNDCDGDHDETFEIGPEDCPLRPRLGVTVHSVEELEGLFGALARNECAICPASSDYDHSKDAGVPSSDPFDASNRPDARMNNVDAGTINSDAGSYNHDAGSFADVGNNCDAGLPSHEHTIYTDDFPARSVISPQPGDSFRFLNAAAPQGRTIGEKLRGLIERLTGKR